MKKKKSGIKFEDIESLFLDSEKISSPKMLGFGSKKVIKKILSKPYIGKVKFLK